MPSENQIRSLVVVPTYDEAENIASFLDELLEAAPEVDILVVDDSSPDGTGRIVQKYTLETPRVHLLERKEKTGLAGAYIAGFCWGFRQGYDKIVQMDADFSHPPSDVPRLLQSLDKHDMAIGCRYIKGGKVSGWSLLRKFISRGGNLYAKTMLRLPLHDVTGGFNGWRRERLEEVLKVPVQSAGYAYQVELKNRAYRAGYKIEEIPIHFRNREKGESKMSGNIVWEAALRVLKLRGATS